MKLSIITINYNNSEGLERTIKSITNQSFSDFEYLIIDGGSNDNSVDVIKKYSAKINYWISEKDTGVYNAMNKGITQAKGEYLLFINSGDLLYNRSVLSEVFKNPLSHDLVYGDLHRVFLDGTEDIVKIPDYVGCDQMMEATLPHPTTFIRRDLFEKYGLYREDLKIVSDWAFFLKLIVFANTSRLHLPIVIATFSMDGLSSTNGSLVRLERQKVINEMFSYELYSIYYTHGSYKSFYNHKIFRFIRSIKHSLKEISSKQYWLDKIHQRRNSFLIKIFDRKVRKQLINPLSIPILIINYNRLTDLQQLVSFLLERGHENIVIIDNQSSYPPLLKYYKEIADKVSVRLMDYNYGHLVVWQNKSLYDEFSSEYYIVTDSDILPNKNLPKDYLKSMITLLNRYKNVSKVGFALQIDDIPDHYELKNKVLEWEAKHWLEPIDTNLYLTDIDTTFALYPPSFKYIPQDRSFFKGIRIAGDFIAKHSGWYSDSLSPTEEEIFYKKSTNKSNNW